MKKIYSLSAGVQKIRTSSDNFWALAGLAVTGLAAAIALPLAANAATTTTTVLPSNLSTIFSKQTIRPESSFNFVQGPLTAPLGAGSLELTTVNSNGKQQYLETHQLGTKLIDINALSYSTYRHADSSASAVQTPSLNMEVSTVGNGTGFTTLVFEPVYNTNQGNVEDGVWQAWDAYSAGAGRWWSTKNIPGVCAFDCFVSWSDIVEANPNAVVLSYGVNQGGGNPGLHANVDALKIATADNSWTYDFEPYLVATDKNKCKDGGWNDLRAEDGSSFKNQGACVSYVASNGKSQH